MESGERRDCHPHRHRLSARFSHEPRSTHHVSTRLEPSFDRRVREFREKSERNARASSSFFPGWMCDSTAWMTCSGLGLRHARAIRTDAGPHRPPEGRWLSGSRAGSASGRRARGSLGSLSGLTCRTKAVGADPRRDRARPLDGEALGCQEEATETLPRQPWRPVHSTGLMTDLLQRRCGDS